MDRGCSKQSSIYLSSSLSTAFTNGKVSKWFFLTRRRVAPRWARGRKWFSVSFRSRALFGRMKHGHLLRFFFVWIANAAKFRVGNLFRAVMKINCSLEKVFQRERPKYRFQSSPNCFERFWNNFAGIKTIEMERRVVFSRLLNQFGND